MAIYQQGNHAGQSLASLGAYLYQQVYGRAPGFTQKPAWWANWIVDTKNNQGEPGQKLRALMATWHNKSPIGAALEILTSAQGRTLSETILEMAKPVPMNEVSFTTLLVNQADTYKIADWQYYNVTRKAVQWAVKQINNRNIDLGYLDAVLVNMVFPDEGARRLPIWQNPVGPNPTPEEIASWGAFLRSTHWSGSGSVIDFYSDYSKAAWMAQSASYAAFDKAMGIIETSLRYMSLQQPMYVAQEKIAEFFGLKTKLDAGIESTQALIAENPNAATPKQITDFENAVAGLNGIYSNAYKVLNPLGLWEGTQPSGLSGAVTVVLAIKAAVWITVAGAMAYIVHEIVDYVQTIEDNNMAISQQAMDLQKARLGSLRTERDRRKAQIAEDVAAGRITDAQAEEQRADLFNWYDKASSDVAAATMQIQQNKLTASNPFGGIALAALGIAALAGVGYMAYKKK